MTDEFFSAKDSSYVRIDSIPDWLRNESRRIQVNRGDQLLRREDRLEYVYIVCSGRINIFSIGANGQENKIVMVPQGGIVGEMEALSGVDRIVYTARALENSELLRIPVESFLHWIRSDQQACWGLAQLLAEKLCAAAMQSSQYTQSDAMQRLIHRLVQLGPGKVHYTRQELAEECSVSLRTVNRCVKKLRDDGLISLSKGKIEISPAQYAALVEQGKKNI